MTPKLRTLWPFDTALGQEQYIQRLLQRYQETPTTAGHIRPTDQQLARHLFQRGVPLALAFAAFSLAATRRIFRRSQATPLNPIRSLHYFLPILEELVADPPDPSYIEYISAKLRQHKPQSSPVA
jgi:hypothetical protein